MAINEKQVEFWKREEQIASSDKGRALERLKGINIEALAIKANEEYRKGGQFVSDWYYDNFIIKALKEVKPESLFLQNVETDIQEEAGLGRVHILPERMLSTNKAYSDEEIKKWFNEVIKANEKVNDGESRVEIRVTLKLDGFAAYCDGEKFYTRGDGYLGQDITRIVERGVSNLSTIGPGEIVVVKHYFEDHLKGSRESGLFENSRNVIAAVIKPGELSVEISNAIRYKAINFIPFKTLNEWTAFCRKDEYHLLDEAIKKAWKYIDDDKITYDVDGIVLEATKKEIKDEMGATGRFHKWQIAYKRNVEFHDAKVVDVIWQTSKNGRITPVVAIEPTKISGVTITKATGFHAGNIYRAGIGVGATVKVCRAGQVIPHIHSVVERAIGSRTKESIPKVCPSCGSAVKLIGDNLTCTNVATCCAQVEGKIEFFFKTVRFKGMGPYAIERICNSFKARHIKQTLTEFCNLGASNIGISTLRGSGFGNTVAEAMVSQMKQVMKAKIEDWRFMSAFGIESIGESLFQVLLKKYTIKELFEIDLDELRKLDGFGKERVMIMKRVLPGIRNEVLDIRAMFNVVDSKSSGRREISNITEKSICFTGTMPRKRDDIELEARLKGADVKGSVGRYLDFLVLGENVGETKIEQAKKYGITMLSYDEYMEMLWAE